MRVCYKLEAGRWEGGGLVIFVNVRVKPLPHTTLSCPEFFIQFNTQTFLTFCTLARHCFCLSCCILRLFTWRSTLCGGWNNKIYLLLAWGVCNTDYFCPARCAPHLQSGRETTLRRTPWETDGVLVCFYLFTITILYNHGCIRAANWWLV